MRVTVVTTTTPGVLKPRTLSFAESLRGAGHEVRLIVCSDVSLGITREFDAKARGQLAGRGFAVDTVDVSPPTKSVIVKNMLTRGVSSEVAAYGYPEVATRVRALLDAHGADVAHVDRIRALQFVGETQMPMVLDLTDPRGFMGIPRLRLATLRHRETAVDAARQVVDIIPARREELEAARRLPCLTASEESARAMVAAGAPAAHVTAVPNATTVGQRGVPAGAMSGRRPRLAMTGNYRYAPNVLAIHDLAAALASTRPGSVDQTILIGARGSDQAMRAARRLGFASVTDVDSVPGELVRQQIDACVAPHSVMRGFPNRIVDSLYFAGKPIFVSSATARMLPDVVADALPVFESPAHFGELLDQVLSRSRESDELVEKGQAAIESACDEAVVAAALERVYRRAMTTPRTGRITQRDDHGG